jgi:hypothetical protein
MSVPIPKRVVSLGQDGKFSSSLKMEQILKPRHRGLYGKAYMQRNTQA